MNEDDSFEMMKHLLISRGLRKQYKPEMDGLQVCQAEIVNFDIVKLTFSLSTSKSDLFFISISDSVISIDKINL